MVAINKSKSKSKLFSSFNLSDSSLNSLSTFTSKRSIHRTQQKNDIHSILKKFPNLCTVRNFVKVFPDSVNVIDSKGHFPLQTALVYGAFPNVIKYLVNKNETAATHLDKNGRTCLHLALSSHERVTLRGDRSKREIFELYNELIDILCSYDSSTIHMEDNNGMNVLEYAIEKEVCYKVIQRLQKISENVLKNVHYSNHGGYGIRDSSHGRISRSLAPLICS